MSRVIVGKWGKSLAIRIPLDVARTSGLSNGEAVEIETLDGDIFIRRRAAKAEASRDAEAEALEIFVGAKRHSLGGIRLEQRRGGTAVYSTCKSRCSTYN